METPISKVIAFVLIGLFAFVTISVLFIPLKNSELAHLLVGDLIGMSTMLVGFYWGSSSGSKDKAETIKKKLDGELDSNF